MERALRAANHITNCLLHMRAWRSYDMGALSQLRDSIFDVRQQKVLGVREQGLAGEEDDDDDGLLSSLLREHHCLTHTRSLL